jgi:CRP/FNR family transcriptional regulator
MVLNLELYEIIKSEKGLVKKDLKKDEVLFHEGDIPSGIFCIESGNVKLVKNESSEKKRIVHLATKGEILGLHAILNEHPYTNTAIVMEKTSVIFLNAGKFQELIENNNSYKLLVMKTLCSRIDSMEYHINLISEKQTEQRFADTLLLLINKYGLKQKKTLKINLSLDELASFTCTSRSYMKKIVIDFSNNGLISYHSGEINILDKKQIESIASSEKNLAGA